MKYSDDDQLLAMLRKVLDVPVSPPNLDADALVELLDAKTIDDPRLVAAQESIAGLIEEIEAPRSLHERFLRVLARVVRGAEGRSFREGSYRLIPELVTDGAAGSAAQAMDDRIELIATSDGGIQVRNSGEPVRILPLLDAGREGLAVVPLHEVFLGDGEAVELPLETLAFSSSDVKLRVLGIDPELREEPPSEPGALVAWLEDAVDELQLLKAATLDGSLEQG